MASPLMAKLYSTIMEQTISSWAEHHHKRALGQVGLRSQHSGIDHLVTLKVTMEKVGSRKNLYCCFLDFMKAIDTLSRTEHWERMIEIGMLLKYRAVVA